VIVRKSDDVRLNLHKLPEYFNARAKGDNWAANQIYRVQICNSFIAPIFGAERNFGRVKSSPCSNLHNQPLAINKRVVVKPISVDISDTNSRVAD
jgi:hypothetical protein